MIQLEIEYKPSKCSEEHYTRKRKKYSKTKTATKLVSSSNLSTSKEANIFHPLSQKRIDFETTSQPGIYKPTINETIKLKEEIKHALHLANWSLHFEGKRIDGQELEKSS